mmetsp:Transcript_18083/g.29696  ORF Transcript_18083/g.29696 Transcript_18083/m.29696 type:complete len:393 (-) Transcript_18083:819-1997(-)
MNEPSAGYLWSWGLGRNGQLGHGQDKGSKTNVNGDSKENTVPRIVKALSGKQVRAVSCGGLFTCVLTAKGQVYSFGCGKSCRLGHREQNQNEEDCWLPQLVEIDHVIQVACGDRHSAAITGSGEVYTWGYGKGGVLGHGDEENQERPKKVEGLAMYRVVQVASGRASTMALTDKGAVFTWGCNKTGILGHGDKKDRLVPALVEAFQGTDYVEKIAMGFEHAACVTGAGKVFTWGRGDEGQLGHGNTESYNAPKLVESLQAIPMCDVSCSVGQFHGHSACVAEDGVLYTWGDGYKGKLGHGGTETELHPRAVAGLTNVKHVACGGIHMACLTEDGNIYTWGCGSDGRLGHLDAAGHRYLYKESVPRMVEALKGKLALSLSSAYYHMACVTGSS